MQRVRVFTDTAGHKRVELLKKSLAEAGLSLTSGQDGAGPRLLLITDADDFSLPKSPEDGSPLYIVKLKSCDLPKPSDQYRLFDLSKWRGSKNNSVFKELVPALQSTPSAAPPETEIVQPISVASTPVPTSSKKIVQWFAGLSVMAIASGILFFTFNILSLQNNLCSIKFGQPTLSDFCGGFGLGGKPVREERIAWEAIEPRQCEPLRRHIELFPEGAFHDVAADLLEARRNLDVETWTPQKKQLTLFVGADGESHTDESTAKKKALEQGMQKAIRLCQGFAASTNFRLNTSAPVAEHWRCDSYETGYVCGFEGQAVCDVDVRRVTTKEVCGPQT